ncbi:class I SAM-dependent methyltransferase [Actinoplanes sp. NBRC 101535]|uniref:class I SAM-dependent methyltransferase n=1 Tax=Actinoplanes sp. NBRC 101535 TaxID=3032196 RepID=UPI0024A2726B|nr:class I SAM-dependent methyltransferase [Actinoplanes sp. NBRC 101535]GLY01850.1 methyltransferase type 11 [Actinoplanes sp. NBRC 101535]
MWHGERRHARLVEVYDAEFPWGWEDDFFMAVLAERSTHRVLDLGCGTGRLAIAMARDGRRVTGVDTDPAALDAARGKPGGDRVEWVEGTAAQLGEAEFDAAFMTGHVVHRIGDDAWPGLLRSLRRALVPGGRLVFDSRDPVGGAADDGRKSIVLDNGSTVDAWSAEGEREGGTVLCTRHYRFPDGSEITNTSTLRLRTETEIRESLVEAGFRVEQIYGGWGREPVGLGDGELIVIAGTIG